MGAVLSHNILYIYDIDRRAYTGSFNTNINFNIPSATLSTKLLLNHFLTGPL